ncbi:MAG: glyoxylase family protein [Thermoleophilaceae bacterium]|nr:glyoxylase family protein [Thermoleophilaceae bacterium]
MSAQPPEEPRRLQLRGIHHITLICASLERSAAFYRDTLGLRLVEESVNQDDPSARHFYFGDAHGAPGTVITCMEYPQMEEGTVGRGSTHHFAFAVETAEELEGWRSYLESRGIGCTQALDRTYFRSIYLRDPDGHIVEIATRGPGFAVD